MHNGPKWPTSERQTAIFANNNPGIRKDRTCIADTVARTNRDEYNAYRFEVADKQAMGGHFGKRKQFYIRNSRTTIAFYTRSARPNYFLASDRRVDV